MEPDDTEIYMLRKMYLHGYVGKRHTSLDNLQKSLPKHKRGDANSAVKNLTKKNWIIVKSTGYGQHCSLNIRKIHEIRAVIYSPSSK